MSESKIEITPYDPQWPKIFEAEAERIKKALGQNCIAIHHIGSTSIVGLSAKPIIDILPVVEDITEVDNHNDEMSALGYETKGEYGLAFRRHFNKRTDNTGFNIHIYEKGDTEIARYLNFLNWLRTHEEDRQAYENLKLALAEKYPHDMLSYCMGKDALVASIDKKAGFNGYKMVIALMDREWQAFSEMQLAANVTPKIEKTTYTDEAKKTHFPFVLFKGDKIIGVAHVEFVEENQAILHSLFLNTGEAPQESEFYRLLTKWVDQKGFTWSSLVR